MLPKILVIIVIVVLGVIGLGFASRQFANKPPSQFTPSQSEFRQDQKNRPDSYFDDVSQLPPCEDKKEFFKTLPLSLDSFTIIDPLGLLSPTAHVFPAPHIYFRIKRDDNRLNGAVLKFPIYAPADSTITKITLIQATNEPELVDDAAIYFSPCSEFKAYFDHVVDLPSKIKEAYDKAPIERCDEYTLTYRSGPVNWKNCRKNVNIKITQGELLGYVGGGQDQAALDFGAYDARIKPVNYANPSQSFRPELVYNVCPLDYFSKDLTTKLKDRLGGIPPFGHSETAVKSPTCGKVIQDIAETAKGYWFVSGVDITKSAHEPPHLALVQGHIDQSLQAFSNGDSTKESNLEMGLYFFEPRNSGFINRDFAQVSEGNIYCYETRNTFKNEQLKVIIIQLADSNRLKIAGLDFQSCGSGPWQMTNPTEFER